MPEKNIFRFGNKYIATSDKKLSDQEALQEAGEIWKFTKYLGEKDAKFIEGEYEKTAEELEAIELCSYLIFQEYKDLEIQDSFEKFPAAKIHFLNDEAFKKKSQKNNVSGVYITDDNSISIRKDAILDRLNLYSTMLHEMIHANSFHKYNFDTTTKEYSSHKIGYKSYKYVNKDKSEALFIGLNEAITDLVVEKIIWENKDFLIKKMNVTEEEVSKFVPHRYDYCYLVESIIEKIASSNNEDYQIVWQRFKKGLFTGRMMHLREIEKKFGELSLQALSKLGQSEEINNAVYTYFDNSLFDQWAANKALQEILGKTDSSAHK